MSSSAMLSRCLISAVIIESMFFATRSLSSSLALAAVFRARCEPAGARELVSSSVGRGDRGEEILVDKVADSRRAGHRTPRARAALHGPETLFVLHHEEWLRLRAIFNGLGVPRLPSLVAATGGVALLVAKPAPPLGQRDGRFRTLDGGVLLAAVRAFSRPAIGKGVRASSRPSTSSRRLSTFSGPRGGPRIPPRPGLPL